MSTRLSVNVNKVAVLRNSRGGGTPDVTRAALTCLEAGAHGITVHPRPDRRHIVAEDLPPLAGLRVEVEKIRELQRATMAMPATSAAGSVHG